MYRGTEGEEELSGIISSGVIQSSGETATRLGKESHKGLTFFSDRPNIATSYVQRPGYLIEIKKPVGMVAEGGGEFSASVPIPSSRIARILKIGHDEAGPYASDVTQEFIKTETPKEGGTPSVVESGQQPRREVIQPSQEGASAKEVEAVAPIPAEPVIAPPKKAEGAVEVGKVYPRSGVAIQGDRHHRR